MHEQLSDRGTICYGPNVHVILANQTKKVDDDAVVAVPRIQERIEEM
jgi:hypothetical protein